MRLKNWTLIFLITFNFSAVLSAHNHDAGSKSAWSEGYTLILLDSNDMASVSAAQKMIESMGGRIAIVAPPRVMLGWIPADLQEKLQGQNGIRLITQQPVNTKNLGIADADTNAALGFFNYVVSGELKRNENADQIQDMPPLTGDGRAYDGYDMAGRSLNFIAGNSDSMTGTVAVAVFFVESNGLIDPNSYTWTSQDEDIAYNNILSGLTWWSAQAPTYSSSVTFNVVRYSSTNPISQQPYEPIIHSSMQSSLWVNAITSNLGYGSLVDFNTALKNSMGTNWAFSTFVAYNPLPNAPRTFTDGKTAFAYFGGPYTQLLFGNVTYYGSIMSHETGHIFWACDEYYSPGYGGCTSCGACNPNGPRPTVINGNCEVCNPAAESCMMRNNIHSLCEHTVAQIGWGALVEIELPNGIPQNDTISGSTPQSSWNYYFVDIDSYESLSVELFNLTADADLYLAFDRKPTSFDYDCRSMRSGTTIERCIEPAAGAGRWWIGVTNHATGTIQYSIQATKTYCPGTLMLDNLPVTTASVGSHVSQNLTVSNGAPPYEFTLVSGTVPPGLALYLGGWLTGTPTTSGTYDFLVQAIDRFGCNGYKAYQMTIGTCLFCDEFDDQVLRTDFSYIKGTWDEPLTTLNGIGAKKAFATIMPAFSGCTSCSFETAIANAGSVTGKISFYAWYQDKSNHLELLMKSDTGRWVLKQRVAGKIVSKGKSIQPIVVGTSYSVRMVYTGSNIEVYIDGALAITMPAAAVPAGSAAFQVKNTAGQFDYIRIH